MDAWVDTPYADEIAAHVEKWIGPISYVMHEIVSDRVHIDVLVVSPSAKNKCFTLVTSGMSALSMHVPKEAESFSRAELIITLPADNAYLRDEGDIEEKLDSSDNPFDAPDPPGYYFVHDLKQYAKFPHLADTWIGPGHTLVASDPPKPIGEDTQMTAYIVEFPFSIKSHEGWYLKSKDNVRVNFLELYPIYTEELKFKLANGAESLMDKLEVANALSCVNPSRPSVVQRKKWLGLF